MCRSTTFQEFSCLHGTSVQVRFAPKCAKRESSEHALHWFVCHNNEKCAVFRLHPKPSMQQKLERHFYDLFLDAFSLTQWLQVACGSVCIDLVTVSIYLSGSNSLSKTEGGTCFDITDLDWKVHANWPSLHITISNHGLRWVGWNEIHCPPAVLSSSSGRLILI